MFQPVKILVIASVIALTVIFYSSIKAPNPALVTVMITNLSSNSGGSGTIISHSSTESKILTNGHVCQVVENGGLVHSSIGASFVVSYQRSSIHDLCVITVAQDLKYSTRLSYFPPLPLDEETVSGHPHLLPTILTKGHFSGKMVISVLVDRRPCTDEEKNSQDTAVFCSFVGYMPVVKNYESIVVSSTIQPGSSGSGVYDFNNHIAAVIFAGEGDLGYGLAVPYEFVSLFLNQELKTIHPVLINPRVIFSMSPSSKSVDQKIAVMCANRNITFIESKICKLFKDSDKLSDMIERD